MADDDVAELEQEIEQLKEEVSAVSEKNEDSDRPPAGPGGMPGPGGNPLAQMMGGPGAGPAGTDKNDELVREMRQLRDEVRDMTRLLQQIANQLDDGGGPE